MGIKERRDRERNQVRELIMDTARRLFAAEGYYAVSMRRIAEAIEYSPAAIYVHFKDKESLIRELCTEDFGKLSSEFHRLARETDPVERIRQAGHLYIRFAVKHPNQYKLMFMTDLEHQPAKDDFQGKGNPEQDAYAFLLQSVHEATLTGRFRTGLDDPLVVAQTFWAVVHGVASLQIIKAKDTWTEWASLDTRATCAIDSIIKGLIAKTASAKPAEKKHNRKRIGAK